MIFRRVRNLAPGRHALGSRRYRLTTSGNRSSVRAVGGIREKGLGLSFKVNLRFLTLVGVKRYRRGCTRLAAIKNAYQSFDKQQVQITQPYQLARYSVTHSQFQCFVEAGDFDNPRWWDGMPAEAKELREPTFPLPIIRVRRLVGIRRLLFAVG